ncbi:MAG: hypothetical protein MZV70_55075 [Desulfobacterales bacterium]|nr:hypothetical protein [Desulfobacterales bacterium]
MKKKILIVSGILLLILVALFAWKYFGQTKPPETAAVKSLPAVSVAAATSGSISRTIEPDGTVEAARIARMSSPAEGPIINCGAAVREGDSRKARPAARLHRPGQDHQRPTGGGRKRIW